MFCPNEDDLVEVKKKNPPLKGHNPLVWCWWNLKEQCILLLIGLGVPASVMGDQMWGRFRGADRRCHTADLIVLLRQRITQGTSGAMRSAFGSPSHGRSSVSLRLRWWAGRRSNALGEQRQVCVGQRSLGPSPGASLRLAQHWCFLTETLEQLLEWGSDENSKADLVSRDCC